MEYKLLQKYCWGPVDSRDHQRYSTFYTDGVRRKYLLSLIETNKLSLHSSLLFDDGARVSIIESLCGGRGDWLWKLRDVSATLLSKWDPWLDPLNETDCLWIKFNAANPQLVIEHNNRRMFAKPRCYQALRLLPLELCDMILEYVIVQLHHCW